MPKKYFYSDGNGNSYIISGDTLSYNPVDILHSSSGLYDGGQAKDLVLKDFEKKEIIELLSSATTKPAIHEDKRRKGTSMISILQGEEMQRYILRWKTEEQRLIEETFQKILAGD